MGSAIGIPARMLSANAFTKVIYVEDRVLRIIACMTSTHISSDEPRLIVRNRAAFARQCLVLIVREVQERVPRILSASMLEAVVIPARMCIATAPTFLPVII
mmetsp:Transcript_6809/g.11980  ORF Transcript_6809/g.11980 Transcript_6809/m.11980 type:complete len:102 (-) Transcript_6809:216-521(-)